MKVESPNAHELSRGLKSNDYEAYKQTIANEAQDRAGSKSISSSGIRWNVVKNDKGEKKINPLLETDHVTVSSIRQIDKSVSTTVIAHKLGYKIDLQDKVEVLKDKYLKNFLQSKSHNYIVAKFAEFKGAFLSQLLANLGVSLPELQEMQKKALKGARDENELLFEENEYNAEMISVIGGQSKKLKKELQIMDEIRVQLQTQMVKLGEPDYYNDSKVLEVKLRACSRIKEEFQKELDILEYQKDYFFLNKEKVKTAEKTVFDS
jgi:hypothetical protein